MNGKSAKGGTVSSFRECSKDDDNGNTQKGSKKHTVKIYMEVSKWHGNEVRACCHVMERGRERESRRDRRRIVKSYIKQLYISTGFSHCRCKFYGQQRRWFRKYIYIESFIATCTTSIPLFVSQLNFPNANSTHFPDQSRWRCQHRYAENILFLAHFTSTLHTIISDTFSHSQITFPFRFSAMANFSPFINVFGCLHTHTERMFDGLGRCFDFRWFFRSNYWIEFNQPARRPTTCRLQIKQANVFLSSVAISLPFFRRIERIST